MAFLSSRTIIAILTVVTAAIHLLIGIGEPNPLFIVNGVGYLVLLYVFFWTPGFLQGQKSLIRWVFLGYTLVTIIGYFAAWGLDGFTQVGGMVTKVAEVLLLLGLWQSKA